MAKEQKPDVQQRNVWRSLKRDLLSPDRTCDFCHKGFVYVNGYTLYAFDICEVAIRICDDCLKDARQFKS